MIDLLIEFFFDLRRRKLGELQDIEKCIEKLQTMKERIPEPRTPRPEPSDEGERAEKP
jgi:hypothetical protein